MSSVEPINELPLVDLDFNNDRIGQNQVPAMINDEGQRDVIFPKSYGFAMDDLTEIIAGLSIANETLLLLYSKQKEIITQLNTNTAEIEAINEEITQIKQQIEAIESAIEKIEARLATLENPISLESDTIGNIDLTDGNEVLLLELDTSSHNLPFNLSTNLYTTGNGLVRLEYGGKSLELANNGGNISLPVFKLPANTGIIKITFVAVGVVNADYRLITTTCGV